MMSATSCITNHVSCIKNMDEMFHKKLKGLIHQYILLTYKLTQKYPSEEKFGLTSQQRRAAVSVMLNYIEGYSRMRNKMTLNQFETAYASLKESLYACFLGSELGYIKRQEFSEAYILEDEIGAMLYKTIEKMRTKQN